MSNKRYIEIYSQHRNRTQYPNVSEFVVPLEQSGLRNTSTTALDPVVDAFPTFVFKLNTASSTPATTAVGPAAGPLTFSGGDRTNPKLANTSSFDDNFYNGYHIIDTDLKETRTIVGYVGATQVVTLDFPFGTTWASTDDYNIVDPSVPFNVVITGAAGTVGGATALVPQLDFAGSTITPTNNFLAGGFPAGYFKGFYLQIVDSSGNVREERIVADFIQTGAGATTYDVYLDNAFTIAWPPAVADYFILTNNSYPVISLQPVDVFNFSNPASYNQFYTGSKVYNELTGESRTITAYNAVLKIATLDSGFTSSTAFNPANATIPPYAAATFSIRTADPIQVGVFSAPGSTIGQNIVYLSNTSPAANDVWNGKYLYIRPYSYSYTDVPSADNIYKINKYWGNVAGNPYTYAAQLDKSLKLNAPAGNTYEILNFSYDNFAPLCYSGSTVSQNELVCYEINLISIVLPNITLQSGSRISFYPFVYVQFGTYNSSMNHSNCIIYSNNPDSNKALFICPTTDVSNPLTSQFIKLDAQGGVQTVKFKPNDNMIFSVFLPNGELFLPVLPDNLSPLAPNPLLQIEAVFSIKRLSS